MEDKNAQMLLEVGINIDRDAAANKVVKTLKEVQDRINKNQKELKTKLEIDLDDKSIDAAIRDVTKKRITELKSALEKDLKLQDQYQSKFNQMYDKGLKTQTKNLLKDRQSLLKAYEKEKKELIEQQKILEKMRASGESDGVIEAQGRIIGAQKRKVGTAKGNITKFANNHKDDSIIKERNNIEADLERELKLDTAIINSNAEKNKKLQEQKDLQQEIRANKEQEKQETQERAQAMKKAVEAEKILFETQKQIAEYEKSGKNKYSEEITKLKEVEKSQKNILETKRKNEALTKEQQETLDNIEKTNEATLGFYKKQNNELGKSTTHAKNLGDTLKNIAKYILVYQGLNYLKQGIQEAITTVKELDKAFTDLQMVTGNSDAQMTEMADSYNKLAREMSATTLQVAEGAAEWLRTGKSIEETEDLLRTSMVLSKVGLIESSEATQLLVSTMNGFKLSTEETMGAVDKMVELDMAAATSAQELATALSRTASSAQLAGVSLDNVLAYITTVSSVTRKSAETIGESFKTIFARMGNIKIGKFTDDETGESLNDVEATLNKIGIALRSSQNEFRKTEDVLSDLATKWEKLNDVERNAVAVAIAGKNRVPEYTEMYSAA